MKSKKKMITLLVAGIIMALGPIWGMLGTVVCPIGIACFVYALVSLIRLRKEQ